MSILALLLVACPPPSLPPSVSWAYPNTALVEAGAEFCPWFVATVATDGLTIVEPKADLVDGEGHWHLSVDRQGFNDVVVGSSSLNLFGAWGSDADGAPLVLPPGVTVELTAWLVDNGHDALLLDEDDRDSTIKDTVSVPIVEYDTASLEEAIAGSITIEALLEQNEALQTCKGWPGVAALEHAPPEEE